MGLQSWQKESSPAELQKSLAGLSKDFKPTYSEQIVATTESGQPVLFNKQATAATKEYGKALMKESLRHAIPGHLLKSSISVGSNIYGYDLRAPALLQIPFLTPLRDSTARVQHAEPGNAANWKTINGNGYTSGSFLASPWINEGQRAPRFSLSATTNTAPYVSFGIDGSTTYEAQSAGRGFEDDLALAQFIALEKLMVMEEDAILGGNKTLKLGVANTPTGVTSGSGGFTANLYCVVVGLTYEGYRNQSVTGLVQQMTINTPDGKTMTINGGVGIQSAVSAEASPSNSISLTWGVTPKPGEMAYAWYVGTSNSPSALYLQAITTVPAFAMTATRTTTGQLLSALVAGTDFSVNDGATGGGANQVIGYDGFLTQVINNSQLTTPNSYLKNLQGSFLTASGRGSINEIDAIFLYAWNNTRTTFEEIYVNAQELINITSGVLNGASAPLVRYNLDGDGESYNLVASGTIAYYFNPFVNGGSKIPIIVHPTIPPGTILLKSNRLPAYYKQTNMTTTAEIICRRDYYSIDWAPITREYEFGTYCDSVLAMYAPFAYAVLTGIGNGLNT